MYRLILLCAIAVAASAQSMPGPITPVFVRGGITPALQRYLELTDPQVAQITRVNTSLRQFQADKARRMAQVQQEVQQETLRPTLDPMALGLRYVELEAIRRELDSEQRRTAEAVQALLTPAQRTRVAVLQEALRMYSLACEALQHNLMTPAPPDPQGSFASFLLGSVPACVGGGVRMGDFTFLPGMPQP